MRARSLNFPEGKEPLERGSDFGAVSLSRFSLVQTCSAFLWLALQPQFLLLLHSRVECGTGIAELQ